MKFVALVAAAGRALMAGAEHFAQSDGGQTVTADAKKTLSDAATTAIGYVQANAATSAQAALADGLTKIGVPSSVASLLAGAGVAQGETFLGQLASAI